MLFLYNRVNNMLYVRHFVKVQLHGFQLIRFIPRHTMDSTTNECMIIAEQTSCDKKILNLPMFLI